MNKKKISIVTISFNQQAFLRDCICSVLDQDYPNIEYIVVDPGSKDGSREVIEEYRERIARVVFEPDAGPADGLNKGFAEATGEIFGFLNADDVLLPQALNSVVHWLDTHPQCDVVSGHCRIIDAQGRNVRRFFSDRFSLGMAAYGASLLVQQSTFFRSDVYWKSGGFNVENRIAWDGELFVDMALAGARFSLVDEFWSGFRVHGESITGSGKLEDLRKDYADRIFEKIKGRRYENRDRVVAQAMRYARKLRNYRDTLERLRYGPVFKSRV